MGYAEISGGGATENHLRYRQEEACVRTNCVPQGPEDYPLVVYSRNLFALPTQDCDGTREIQTRMKFAFVEPFMLSESLILCLE